MRFSSEEEEQDVTAKLDPDLEGGREERGREGSQPTSSGYEIQSWPPLSAQPERRKRRDGAEAGREKNEGEGEERKVSYRYQHR